MMIEDVSQSLPLFRAFQHQGGRYLVVALLNVAIPSFIQGISTLKNIECICELVALVAIPSFIQGISTGEGKECMDSPKMGCRNPFLYSGHFNMELLLLYAAVIPVVAIPSFIQGISTG